MNFFTKWLKKRKNRSKQHLKELKRVRDHRYYVKHRDKILKKSSF